MKTYTHIHTDRHTDKNPYYFVVLIEDSSSFSLQNKKKFGQIGLAVPELLRDTHTDTQTKTLITL